MQGRIWAEFWVEFYADFGKGKHQMGRAGPGVALGAGCDFGGAHGIYFWGGADEIYFCPACVRGWVWSPNCLFGVLSAGPAPSLGNALQSQGNPKLSAEREQRQRCPRMFRVCSQNHRGRAAGGSQLGKRGSKIGFWEGKSHAALTSSMRNFCCSSSVPSLPGEQIVALSQCQGILLLLHPLVSLPAVLYHVIPECFKKYFRSPGKRHPENAECCC